MANIKVIEDQEEVRNATMRRLAPLAELGRGNRLEAIKLSEKLPAEVLAFDLARATMWKPSFSILVLDLGLGHRSDDGLQAMKYIHHCFDGAVVIHSTQWQDAKVQEESRKLGIRFGTDKLAPNLEELIKAADAVSFIRSATLGDSLFHSRAPIPDYDPPTDVPDLNEVFLKLMRLGRRFDGTSDSVDWKSVPIIQAEIASHVKAAEEQGYRRFYADHPNKERDGTPHYEFFEDFVINAIPVLLDLESNLRHFVGLAEPHISF